MSFETKMEAFCVKQGLIAPGRKVICALSGGADSMALLWAFYLLREKWDLRLGAAHFNHGLRGEESDRDEAFVRVFCSRMDIPLTVGRGAVKTQGRGLEDAARRARYAFFEELDKDAFVATAHTADDNSETILLHLLRGSGLRGLGGIAPKRGRIIRPLLSHTRQEVEAFLEQWSISFVTDSSNLGQDFLRNRIRQEVAPVLRRENPKFSQNCSRMASGLREDEDYLSAMAEKSLEETRRGRGLDCEAFLKLHPALQNRVMALFLKELGVREPEQVHIAAGRHLAEAERPSARVELPGGVCLERQYGILTAGETMPKPQPQRLVIPGTTVLPGWLIQGEIQEKTKIIENTPFTFSVSCDRIGENFLIVRGRQIGDVISLSGGHRTVKKAMIDRRIPAAQRDNLPVILCGDQVLAVAGLGMDRAFAPMPGEPSITLRIFPRKAGDTINKEKG